MYKGTESKFPTNPKKGYIMKLFKILATVAFAALFTFSAHGRPGRRPPLNKAQNKAVHQVDKKHIKVHTQVLKNTVRTGKAIGASDKVIQT